MFQGDVSHFDILSEMDQVMFGRPILMFSCDFIPLTDEGIQDRTADGFTCNLVFFSAFEDLELPSEQDNPMQRNGIKMLYEPGPWNPRNHSGKQPVLHIGHVEHILCRVPLMPLFLDGSSTNTIPYSKRSEAACYEHGKHDSHNGAGNGSLIYEVNLWLWRFGRGKERTVTVAEAEKMRKERISAARLQAGETRRRKRASKEQ